MSEKLLRFYNLLMFLSGMVMLILGPILDFVMRDYGLNKATAGILSMTYMAGNIPGMLLSSRKVNLDAIRGACFLIAFSLGLMTVAPGSLVFALGFFTAGLAAGFLFSGTAAMAACAVSEQQRGVCLNKLYGWLAMGVVLGPVYSSLWQGFGLWRPVPASYGLFFFLAALFFPKGESCPVPMRQEGTSPKSTQFWLLCAALFLYVGAESAVSVWVVKFLLDQFQITWSNFVLVGLWVNITLGRFLLARIGRKYANISLLVGLSLWSTVFIFLAAFSGVTISVLSFLAVGFGFSGIYSLLIEEGSKIAGESSIGILGTSGVLGASITTGLVGFIAQSWGFSWGIALGGFLTLAIIIAVLLSRKFASEEARGDDRC